MSRRKKNDTWKGIGKKLLGRKREKSTPAAYIVPIGTAYRLPIDTAIRQPDIHTFALIVGLSPSICPQTEPEREKV